MTTTYGPIDIHGYGHSDKTDDWIDVKSAAADISAGVEYIAKLRGVGKVDLFGCSAGTQRAGLYAMEHPERVARLILHAGFWKGSEEFRAMNRKRIETEGSPCRATAPLQKPISVTALFRANSSRTWSTRA